ncbi:MAG: hypothetical protein ISEC1_P1296 [Thiomicrorhabdus sp.]|nr:MAG: hypothetical protein ISEC1_P1296 [Thiomicrorhabdus sp.]
MKTITNKLTLTAAYILITCTIIITNTATAGMADTMINEYIQQGAKPSAEAGKALWNREFIHAKSKGKAHRCASCHTNNLTKIGKHFRTGKLIEPMAPSINSERFTERKKINKWFKRNCKWTVGRECTVQEKADVLVYLKNL